MVYTSAVVRPNLLNATLNNMASNGWRLHTAIYLQTGTYSLIFETEGVEKTEIESEETVEPVIRRRRRVKEEGTPDV